MSDLTSPAHPGYEPAAAPESRGRGVLVAVAVVIPLIGALAVAGPRLWHSVRADPTKSVAVPSLPAAQPLAATELPPDRAPAPGAGQVGDLSRFTARDPFASPLPRERKQGREPARDKAAKGSGDRRRQGSRRRGGRLRKGGEPCSCGCPGLRARRGRALRPGRR